MDDAFHGSRSRRHPRQDNRADRDAVGRIFGSGPWIWIFMSGFGCIDLEQIPVNFTHSQRA